MNGLSLQTLLAQGIISELELPQDFRSGETSLWALDLGAASAFAGAWREWLSPDERERAARFVFLKDQERFVTARGALRILLGQYTDQSPEGVQFAYGPQGKPLLESRAKQGSLGFNLSHSAHLALIAISQGKPVGVDLELVQAQRDLMGIARSCFAPREQAFLGTLPEPDRARAFYRIWTCKEAVLKGIGQGITSGLRMPDVSDGLQSGPSSVQRVTGPDGSRWQVYGFNPAREFEAALAVQIGAPNPVSAP